MRKYILGISLILFSPTIKSAEEPKTPAGSPRTPTCPPLRRESPVDEILFPKGTSDEWITKAETLIDTLKRSGKLRQFKKTGTNSRLHIQKALGSELLDLTTNNPEFQPILENGYLNPAIKTLYNLFIDNQLAWKSPSPSPTLPISPRTIPLHFTIISEEEEEERITKRFCQEQNR